MAVTAGHARASFDLKSATLPLIAVLLKTANLAELTEALQARLGDTPDFFEQDLVLVDLAPVAAADAAIDFPALMALLRSYRVVPLAVRGGSAAQMEAAQAAGLVPAPDAGPARSVEPAPVQEVVREVIHEVVREVPVAAAGALVIDKPLRSGQQVYARGTDLVVMALVNHGAELIADGNVHVYAPLRGKAIAGARGNTDARIFSTCMEPELVSIAGIYRTTEVALPASVLGKPAQVRLVGEKMLFEPL
jgi:septum site-determining protein MinC